MAKTVMLAIISILLVTAIILQPDAAFQSSLQGLTVWWNIIFPGLLPFLVLFELMAAFGLAHAVSTLLQPAMGRLFKLPGEAALGIVLGWLGGYPAGAEAAASLRKRKLVTKQQGQRMLALAHMPNPLFMLVVIGAGFLHKPIVGSMIAAAVWLSSLWLMLAVTLFSRDRIERESPAAKEDEPIRRLLERAAEALQRGREQDGRSFGKALGDSVSASFQKLMMIGGFMIFAAVIAKLSEPVFGPLLSVSGLSFLTQAFFEGHLGAYAAAVWDGPGSGSLINAAAIAGVLAWSGLSGILQAGYAIAGTDLKLLPFIAIRTAHALHAFAFMLLLWKPVTLLLRMILPPGTAPAFLPGDGYELEAAAAVTVKAGDLPLLWPYSVTACFMLAFIGLMISAVLIPYRRTGRSV
ncbi:nucleoside recognition domain-containing protein [Paenibacillus harenae]|uniref:nucleoside recognition domain-containing protein n=1 Tax=Paenibacillus harenae TaxID=306543 RepID=UPI0004209C8E|nr:nucleoside recognition domain-containing protein [Paenibacillus harenae]